MVSLLAGYNLSMSTPLQDQEFKLRKQMDEMNERISAVTSRLLPLNGSLVSAEQFAEYAKNKVLWDELVIKFGQLSSLWLRAHMDLVASGDPWLE